MTVSNDALLEHVALMEALVVSGLARGRIDTEAMALVLSQFHRPKTPLAPVPLHLPALLWAFDHLPKDLGPQDTLWVVGEGVLDSERDRFVRVGPTEWACTGGFMELRQKALAVSVLTAASRQLREAVVGEETLGEIATELAYTKVGAEADIQALAARLALALGLDIDVLSQALQRSPGLLERIVRLSQHPQLQQVKTRGIERSRTTPRAEGLWRELLSGLASLDADHRPIVVWVAPLWVSDLVSPYVREVRPLLEQWSRENLQNLSELMRRGDQDAAYLCANLLAGFDDEVRDEREGADASVGIFTISDPHGARMAKLIDSGRLEANVVDPRVGDLAALGGPAPIVIVLNEMDPDIGYAFARLLAEVRAQFIGISVCSGAVGAPGLESFVASARVAQSVSGAFVFAAPAGGGDHVRPLALPDASYLQLFGEKAGAHDVESAWYGRDKDAAFEEHRAQQDAFVGALWLGDLADASVSQRLWIDSAEDAHYLDCKRAHIADAIAHWRAFLGVDTAGVEGVETAPVVAESDDIPDPDVEPDPDDPPPDRPSRGELKPGNPRDMRSTFRFRV